MRRPWRRCASCFGVCHWHDEAWVCDACGDEWYEDHGPRFAPPDATSAPVRVDPPKGAELYNPPDTVELLAHCVALEGEVERLRDVRETAKALVRQPRSARALANLRAALEEA